MRDLFAVGVDQYVQTMTARQPSRALLTVPHDGAGEALFGPFVPMRRTGCSARDCGVWPIVRDVIVEQSVNVVRGLLPRCYVDYNRDAAEAYEMPQFAASHAQYHGTIFAQVRQMQQWFDTKELLVLDVHGFSNQPSYAPRGGYDIVLGTGNRRAVVHGEPDRALAEHLRACGYEVFLPEITVQNPRPGHIDYLNGGYTVRRIAREFGVSAIQIEIARRFRRRDAAAVGTKLSADLAAFLKEYNQK